MRTSRWIAAACAFTAIALALACTDGNNLPCATTAPCAQQQFSILAPSRGAPLLTSYDKTVLVTKGAPATLTFYFAAAATVTGSAVRGSRATLPPSVDGEPYLRITLAPDALSRMPDDTPIADGQSVAIRAIVDPTTLVVTFLPSKLSFNTGTVSLAMSYAAFDVPAAKRDSVTIVTRADESAAWLALTQVTPVTLGSSPGVQAPLAHFTQYALAY